MNHACKLSGILGAQKSKLDEGFRRQVSLLLENIPLKQTVSLMTTLEAGKKSADVLSV